MKYKCESCGGVFIGKIPVNARTLYFAECWWHIPCANITSNGPVYAVDRPSGGKLIPEALSTKPLPFASDPEEIARLHECADSLAKRIAEQREARIDLNGDAQAMATASINREVERCRALLGEIEAEYLPQDIMLDPLVECWHCKAKHLCDPMDATCSKCGAPFDKARCEEFGFKPDFGKETEG